ncbi:MAG TPA: allophanate hydrolase, partial [Gammaproteobacteria bacterium]|nr:allophanate hydrolase [Gammaproteobacteria bacterium]
EKGQELVIGKIKEAGARAYLLVQGGIQCPDYLDAKATFTLGQFGGHAGRALRTGDILHLCTLDRGRETASNLVPAELLPEIGKQWELHVIPGPQGAPDFFSAEYVET